MITKVSNRSPRPTIVATTRGRPMGKSPAPMDRQNTRKAAAASSSVTRTSQGRQTNDTRPSRTPGATGRSRSVPLMRS
ncbi:hypothetical protein [Actinomadura coerulea]|uniref:hypothetical protein n=1 Tax=Actinomadura coerulea TaxID=46159 RepID=UPI003439CA72